MAVENEAVVLDAVSHQFDEHTILFEEVSCFKTVSLSELAVIRPSCVNVGFLFGPLLEASKYDQFTLSNLKSTHVKLSFWQLQLEELPAVLTLRKSFNAGTWLELTRALLSETSEAVESAAVVEKA